MSSKLIKKERNSSLELLRIICIILIIAHHYSYHGGYDGVTYENLSAGVIFIQIIGMFGRMACSIFALISGYFLINANKKNHYRKIVPLLAEMVFYSVAISFFLYSFNLAPMGLKEIIKSFFPYIFSWNWYIIYYVLLYLLVPFINPWLKSMSRKRYSLMVIILLTIWSIIPTLTNKAWSFSSLDFFLVMYIVGAYIRLHIYGKVFYKNSWNLMWGLGAALLIILSVLFFDLTGYIFKNNLLISFSTYFKEYNTVLAVLFAVFIFMYFANMNFVWKPVNQIAVSVMGIYLIHDNRSLRFYIWEVLFPNINYVNNPYLHAFLKIFAVFIVCLVIDLLRRATVGYIFDSWFYRNCDRMVLWFKKKIGVIRQLIEKIYDSCKGGGE